MQLRQIITFVLILTFFSIAGAQNTVQLSAREIESYSQQSEQIIKYLEGTLNFLGNKTEVTSEKEVIINESYLKIFIDDKVQIEDDLDENREIALSKDVQAYLKDVDFFYKEINFNFEINSVESFVNEKGQIYFKASVNRNLKGITINDDTIDNNQIRYFEINLNSIDNDLKIASIYTTLPNKRQEMEFWWNNMAESWKEYFGEGILIFDTLPFSSIISFDDSSLVAYKWFETIETDTFLITETDTIYYSSLIDSISDEREIYIKYDTINEKLPDTMNIDAKPVYSQIERFRALKKIDISNSILIGNLQPLSELTKLEELNFSNTLIDDLTPLRNLNNLEKLNCRGTPVTILEPLRYSSSLVEINLSYTALEEIELLSNLNSLENINISYTNVSNFQSIAKLENLRKLNISGLKLANESGLSDLLGLVDLIASTSSLSDLSDFENLQKLQNLNIDSTNINDLRGLSGLNELSVLQANNSKISDLSPLLALPELKLVYCDNSMINKQEAQSFIEQKPECMVIYNTFEIVNWWNNLPEVWHIIAYSRMELSNPITKEQLHEIISIKTVNLSNNSQITDLIPLKMLYRLETLNVEGTKINTIEPLRSLKNLSSLNFNNTEVEYVEPLANISSLKIMRCENTKISDLSPLKSNKSLELVYADNSKVELDNTLLLNTFLPECLVIYQSTHLNMWWDNLSSEWQDIFSENARIESSPGREQLQELINSKNLEIKNSLTINNLEVLSLFNLLEDIKISNTNITDISALTYLPRLKELTIPNNPITDISSISRMNILEKLNIENTSVDNLEAISLMVSLKVLNLAGTKVKNLKEIESLTNLEILIINNTGIKSLKYLENIQNLKELRCYNTKIRAPKIEAFKLSNPDCEVVYY